ncbi:MAG: YkgJ family cysteine cluster protein [Myxococcales bacterium]|nr:YkgJ family cysteine cluster protein [Myxococcales bacterium]
MVRLRVVTDDDGRSPAQRAQDLHRARSSDDAQEQLRTVLAHLRSAQELVEARLAHGELGDRMPEAVWPLLDRAYGALDAYFALLLHTAAIDPSCGPRCSACCTDLPPILPVEALRMARALRARDPEHARNRLQRAVDQARGFQALLLERAREQGEQAETLDASSPIYRQAQLDWRRLGHPCPILGDDGSCRVYEARPLSCRAHVHVEDPAHCEPASPRFLSAERPPLWGHPRECEVELALVALGKLLGLPGVPNLQWGLARLHEHPLAR